MYGGRSHDLKIGTKFGTDKQTNRHVGSDVELCSATKKLVTILVVFAAIALFWYHNNSHFRTGIVVRVFLAVGVKESCKIEFWSMMLPNIFI